MAEKKEIMGNNEGTIEGTLKERGNVYGDYMPVLKARSNILKVLKTHHRNVNGMEMTKELEVALGDLVLKLVRGAGAPNYADSWHDLGGYAKLIEDIAIDDGDL